MSLAARLGASVLALSILLGAVALGALLVGSAHIPVSSVLGLLAGRPADDLVRLVVFELRLPRVVAAVLAGGALAVAGVAFQSLTRNPLAEPSLLGVSGGAAFGIVAGELLGFRPNALGALGLAALALAGACVAGAAVYAIARTAGGLPVHTLLLSGLIVGIFFASAITVLISLADVNRLGGIIHWLLGNVRPVAPVALAVFGALAAGGFALVLSQARRLNVLALGEESARQLGVDAEVVKWRVFGGAALLTATAVAFAGPIGFVGLVVPHMLRTVLGSDTRLLVPSALLAGGVFLLGADTVARTVVAPAELPVGVVTALCGAPFFVVVLRSRAGRGSTA
jgi:iron complex transport system permease protein